MRRSLLWLAGGLLLFVLAALLLAPGALVLRALGLSLVAIVPAAIVVVLLGDSRRRSNVYGGHTPRDPGADQDEADGPAPDTHVPEEDH